MKSQTPNLKFQTSKESIIAKLRGRLKLDQQTAAEILESPEIEYGLSDIPAKQLRQLTKARSGSPDPTACLLDLALVLSPPKGSSRSGL